MNQLGPNDLLAITALRGESQKRFFVFDGDVMDVQIAYRDYVAARARLTEIIEQGSGLPRTAEVIHYAKTFVLAVRRVARLAQDLANHRSDFGPLAGDRIKVAWQKKRALLESYTEPRNAIEHIQEELAADTSWILTSLDNDTLVVTARADQRAAISASTVEAVVNLRAEVVAALAEEHGA